MDARTEELQKAHDVLADFYVTMFADETEPTPVERAMLNLFSELTLVVDPEGRVADVGCGTGRIEPYLASHGLHPRGVDLSHRMVEVARRDHPEFDFAQADLRDLPFADGDLPGVVCWYSLIFLAPEDRPAAFRELARVIRPGGYLVTAFKDGDGSHGRGGHSTGTGVEFDRFWMSADEMMTRFAEAGFAKVFEGSRPPEEYYETVPGGYLLVRRVND